MLSEKGLCHIITKVSFLRYVVFGKALTSRRGSILHVSSVDTLILPHIPEGTKGTEQRKKWINLVITGWERTGQMLCIVNTSLSVLMTLRMCLRELCCLFTVWI